jgi:S1-C subfamily serine protease
MSILPSHSSQHCWNSFLVFTAIIGFASSTRAQTPDSTSGQEPPSVHTIEQQIQNLYASAGKAVVRIDDGDSRGICSSGVIVSDDGYVLNRNPYLSGKLLKVHLSDGRTVSAKRLGWSIEWQISVLKIVDEGVWPYVEIGSTKKACVGQPCVVIGYPTRGDTKFDRAPSIGYGAIEHLDASNWFTTTCVVSPFEFPPIFSMDGKLLGIVVANDDEVATAADVITENWDDLVAGKNLDWVRYPPRKDTNYHHNPVDIESDDLKGPSASTLERLTDLTAAKKIAQDTTVRLVSKSRMAFYGGHHRWSGVIVSKDGHILTCGHARQLPGERVTVSLSDGRDFDGVVLGTNFVSDVGLVKITDSGTWPVAQIVDSSPLAVGDPLVVCGYPAMTTDGKPSVLRNPQVSVVALRRPFFLLWFSSFEVTRAAGGGGMSGGGVFDSQGRYVGVYNGSGHTRSEIAKLQWEHLASVKPFPPPGQSPYSAIRKALAPQADKSSASVVEIVVGSKQVALGTIVRADGWIITKASVLTADAKCRLSDGGLLNAELRHVVHEHDLAFLMVDAENLPVTTFPAAENIKAGAIVAAVLPGELPRCGVVSVETRPIPAEDAWTGDGLSDTPRGVEVTQIRGIVYRDVAQRPKDIIREINGHSTPDVASLKRLLGQELKDSVPGDLIEMKVTRAGSDMTFKTPLLPSDGYLHREIDSSYTPRRSGFAAVFDSDVPLKRSLCGGPVIDASGQTVGIVIASRGRDDELRGPTMVLPASVVKAVTDRVLVSQLSESPSH